MADASFLSSTRAIPTTSIAGEEAAATAASSSAVDATAKSATAELYRTNLLRLETTELLTESILHLSPFSGELDREVKWSEDVRRYIETVKGAVEGMEGIHLSPNNALMATSSEELAVERNSISSGKKYWANLFSDKFQKHDSDSTDWSFPFSGGKSLQIEPIGEYGAGGAGMTNQRGNALCLPVVDLAVLVSAQGSGEADGMIGGKDYLNGRYFDVSIFTLPY